MRVLAAAMSITLFSGCASNFSVRPPVIEDKLGISGQQIVGTLATAPDYRVLYVKLADVAKVCAEAPADAGAQFGQAFAAGFSQTVGGGKALSLEAKAGLAVAMKQLFKRSQGVQFYRDGTFALCNLHLNMGLSAEQYLTELRAMRNSAAALIEKEIPYLEKLTIDPIVVPVVSSLPAVDGTSKAGATGQK